MGDLKQTISKNIIDLRKSRQLTQAELAAKLNYSDKAISKWERAESIPDIVVLKEIADIFGVSVDYLITEEHSDEEIRAHEIIAQDKKNRLIVSLLANALVWLMATITFVYIGIYDNSIHRLWTVYLYAIPVSLIVMLIFNSIWGNKRRNFLIISMLVWSVLLALYMILYKYNIWLVFVVGIPAQFIIFLWSKLKVNKNKA